MLEPATLAGVKTVRRRAESPDKTAEDLVRVHSAKTNMKNIGERTTVFLLLLAGTVLSTTVYARKPDGDNAPKSNATVSPAKLKIDLNQAVEVKLPQSRQELMPVGFKTAKGQEGWIVRVPGGRPIATPAYADGMLFVGGGYGSHEFYAFNANTGEVVWKINTGDDGPTAAVVEAGYVGFNTESCTVLVVDEKTGKIVWKEWLGDPLMSQPAISDGKLFIAYPGGQRNHKQQVAPPANSQGFSHRLLAADLKTGKHLWEQPIPTDVISAPVISGDEVYVTCFDGTSLAFNAKTGGVLWTKKGEATSAPLAVGNQVVLTKKQRQGAKVYEGLTRLDANKGEEKDKELIARTDADYLAEGRGSAAIGTTAEVALDSSVGFSTAPSSAKLAEANKNVGVKSVVGGWAFQGSRAAHNQDSLFNAQGRYLNSVSVKDGKAQWQAEVEGSKITNTAQLFAPPALGHDYMYLAGANGVLISVRQKDGAMGFAYSLGKPIAFQPALAKGNIYVGTTDGSLICLKTGNTDAEGWYSWGGNAQHNK